MEGAAVRICWITRPFTGGPGETLEPRTTLPLREWTRSYAGDDFWSVTAKEKSREHHHYATRREAVKLE